MEDEHLNDFGPDGEPSRSARRREALHVFELAEALMLLSPAQLEHVPMPEDLRALVIESKRITQHVARKRQTQFLAKQMRREAEALPPIEAWLAHGQEERRRDGAKLHRVERWRDRLIAEGDVALEELVQEAPEADRHALRTLARRADAESRANKPPAASRALFKALRELLEPS